MKWNSPLHSHKLDPDAVPAHASDDSADAAYFDQAAAACGYGKFLPDASEHVVLLKGHEYLGERKKPSKQLGVSLGAVVHPGPAQSAKELKLSPRTSPSCGTRACFLVLAARIG